MAGKPSGNLRYDADITSIITGKNMPGLLRLIILALIVWLIIRLYRRLTAGSTTQQTSDNTTRPVENMVRCETCGTHLPEKIALKKNDHYYCSQAHLPRDD